MNDRLMEIRQRRGMLLERIRRQREQLADFASTLQGPLALADRGVRGVRFLSRHSGLVAGVVALVVIRRGGFVNLLKRSWILWKGTRYLADLLQTVTQRHS